MHTEAGVGKRKELAPWLLGIACAIIALSALAHELAQATGAPSFWPSWEQDWWGSTWGRVLLLGTAALGGLALLLSLISLWKPRTPAPDLRSLEELSTTGLQEALREVRYRTEEALRAPSLDISLALDEILQGALRVHASDLHLSPSASQVTVTYRVHGSLYEVAQLDSELGQRLAIRIKVLARMNTYSREPQDGRLRYQVGEIPLEARVSSLPADAGERLVLRLVRGTRKVPELAQLGFSTEVEEGLRAILAKPQGMLFVSGPVGSGKTTTLYSALAHISTSRGSVTSLVTLEDPIELELPFATQTQINARMGMSFAQTLRSVLRQDPNVLMLGEIRDRETAEIATQAGLTGHLILTTIHVESAAGTFARLIEMDVEPFIVASATVGCVSQRLIRVLCTHCRRAVPPDPLLIQRFQKLGVQLPEHDFYEPQGCEFCEEQGYTGRQPVAELLVLTPALRQAIHERRPTEHIQALAVAEGMLPLREAALRQALEGVTSLSEVLRISG